MKQDLPILLRIEQDLIKTLLRITYRDNERKRKNERVRNLLKHYCKITSYYGLGEGWFDNLLEPIRYDVASHELYRMLKEHFELEEYRTRERTIKTFMIGIEQQESDISLLNGSTAEMNTIY